MDVREEAGAGVYVWIGLDRQGNVVEVHQGQRKIEKSRVACVTYETLRTYRLQRCVGKGEGTPSKPVEPPPPTESEPPPSVITDPCHIGLDNGDVYCYCDDCPVHVL